MLVRFKVSDREIILESLQDKNIYQAKIFLQVATVSIESLSLFAVIQIIADVLAAKPEEVNAEFNCALQLEFAIPNEK